ncbi:hypothetical protein Dimus_027284 [Dionaea muscipula]
MKPELHYEDVERKKLGTFSGNPRIRRKGGKGLWGSESVYGEATGQWWTQEYENARNVRQFRVSNAQAFIVLKKGCTWGDTPRGTPCLGGNPKWDIIKGGAITAKPDGNKLTGEIPLEISNLKNLQVLHLWNNSLTGSLPSSSYAQLPAKVVEAVLPDEAVAPARICFAVTDAAAGRGFARRCC